MSKNYEPPSEQEKPPKNWIWKFSLVAIIGICILFGYILSSKSFIESRVNSGFSKIVSLKQNHGSVEEVEKTISSARLDFILAYYLFLPYRVVNTQEVLNGKHIISAWKSLSESLLDFITIYNLTEQFIAKKGLQDVMYSQLLSNLKPYFLETEKNIHSTLDDLKSIKNLNNLEVQRKIEQQIISLSQVDTLLWEINTNFDDLLSILWHNKTKKYLLIFQNADEIRPTWGFMWSMWIIEIFRGKLKNYTSKDIYAYEWDLKRVEYDKQNAPEWLNKITQYFWLRDANYFTNFKDSSTSIKYFLDTAGYQIDGIIYINQNVIKDLLSEIWWIDFSKINERITEYNFSEIMSLLVEAKKFKEGTLGTPKQILFDFIHEFLRKVQSDYSYQPYIKVLASSIKKRDITLYSFDKKEQNFLKNISVAWNFNFWETLDFSAPFYTSVSWNKSDRYMRREYQKVVKVNPDCSIDTSLKVIQKHTYSKARENILTTYIKRFEIPNQKEALSIQGKGQNYEYIRVLVPKDAIVSKQDWLTVEDFEKYKSLNFYLKTSPKEVKSYQLKYTLKNPSCLKYNFALYKQPWVENYSLFLYDWKKTSQTIWIDQDFFYNTTY